MDTFRDLDRTTMHCLPTDINGLPFRLNGKHRAANANDYVGLYAASTHGCALRNRPDLAPKRLCRGIVSDLTEKRDLQGSIRSITDIIVNELIFHGHLLTGMAMRPRKKGDDQEDLSYPDCRELLGSTPVLD